MKSDNLTPYSYRFPLTYYYFDAIREHYADFSEYANVN
jgi:hypothetical protein